MKNIFKENKKLKEENNNLKIKVNELQKEIERLKDKLNKIYNETDNKNSQLVKALNYKLFMEDKIKAKIEEYKESGSVDGTNDILITEMQSLLEKE